MNHAINSKNISEFELIDGSNISSTIFAGGDFTINSPTTSLINNGSIISGKDMNLNIASLTNASTGLSTGISTGLSTGTLTSLNLNGAVSPLAQIKSGNNLSITAVGDIKNLNNSLIQSKNNLDLLSLEGDIKNIGANISSIKDLNLVSLNGNIINSAIVQTNDAKLLASNSDSYQLALGDSARSSGNIQSSLLQNASLSGGNINIIAAKDFTNLAAEITTTKNLIPSAITTSSAITQPSTLVTPLNNGVYYDTSENLISASASINQTPQQVRGDSVGANGDNGELLSNAAETSGNLIITAGNDINIGTLELRNRVETSWGSKKKGGISITDTTTNLASNISADGGIDLASGVNLDSLGFKSEDLKSDNSSNVVITGSNLTAADNITLSAKGDVIIQSAQDLSYSFSAGRTGKGKSFLNSSDSTTQVSSNLATTNNGDITITSGIGNTDIIGSDNAKGSIALIASNLTTKDSDNNSSNDLGSGDINLTAKENILITSAMNSSLTESLSGKKTSWVKKSHGELDETLTNISSNIIASGDILNAANAGGINLASGNDTTITASNLSGSDGNIFVGKYVDPTDSSNITYNPNAILTIQSGQDYHYHLTTDMKIEKDAAAVAVGAVAAAAVVIATGGTGLAVVGAAGGGAMVGSGAERGRTLATVTQEITQKSSTLNFSGDLNIQSASDTTITASNLTADNGTILTGEFKDQTTDAKTIINPDAELKLNSAFNSYSNTTTIKQVKPNYVGVALTSAASTYAGIIAGGAASNSVLSQTGSQLLAGTVGIVANSAASSAVSNSAGLVDSLSNIRTKHTYSTDSLTEIKTNLDFKTLTTE